MITYNVILTGKTPLLMHHDNLEWADKMDAWKAEGENKKLSKAGDDRTPAWRWLGALYHDGQSVGIPQANIMRSLMEGGAMVPVPNGKMGKTFKAQTQSGMMCVEPFWPIEVRGQTLAWSKFDRFKDLELFTAHKELALKLGFELIAKRAKIGMSKHIRVRPQFAAGWVLRGTIAVWDEQINLKALQDIAKFAGQYKGLGDWRPGGRTPGPYGTFEADVSQI